MFKKITAVIFVLALVAFAILPGNEARIDVVSTSIKESAYADELSRNTNTYSYGADGQKMTMQRDYQDDGQSMEMDGYYGSDDDYGDEESDDADVYNSGSDDSNEAEPTPAPSEKPSNAPTPTPLVSGVSNADVVSMQARLIELGFMDGSADGIYGADTITAVQDVKKFLNEQYLKSNPTPPPTTDENGNVVVTDESVSLPYNSTGDGDYAFLQALYNTDFTKYMSTLKTGDTGAAVKRLQTRLIQLGYIYKGADGAYGNTTTTAVSNFQEKNGLAQSGIADMSTQKTLFSSSAQEYGRPLWEYSVVVDLSEQRVYVYKWDEKKNDYTNLVKKWKCSTGASGTPTPKGIYKETVRRGAEWHHFKDFGNCWARYAIHIDPTGNIMFHSVLYTRKGGSPTSSSVHALGRRASHGCIRLAVDDAKWLYEHITDGTTVTIKK